VLVFDYLLMLCGGTAMSVGFYLFGQDEGRRAWGGIALLFAGLIAAFLGVLLAFAPHFFS
jgi:hypothetical protein